MRGARLLGAEFRIHARDEVYAVTGRLVENPGAVDPGPPRAWTVADVQARIRELLALPEGFNIDVEAVVLPGVRMWAFRAAVLLYSPHPNDLRLLISNESLDLLTIYSASRNATAMAYEINPLRSATKQSFTLGPLAGPPYELRDGMADVLPRRGKRLRQDDDDFDPSEKEGGFDEVQAFVHARRGLEFFGDLLPAEIMNSPILRPVKAVVRDFRSPDQAWFVPSTGELDFGDYDGIRPSARSADVVIHELGHAVSHLVCDWTESQVVSVQGLNEGFADYFACAALGSPIMLDYVTNTLGGDRNCDRPGLRFPRGFRAEPHALGEVWANVLWSIRAVVGPAADRIAAESLHFFDGSSTFDAAPTYLEGADAKLFPGDGNEGRHASVVRAAWEARLPDR